MPSLTNVGQSRVELLNSHPSKMKNILLSPISKAAAKIQEFLAARNQNNPHKELV
jgi:hypothetical protein